MKIESDFITIYNIKPDYDLPDYIHVFSLEIDGNSPFLKTFFKIVIGASKVDQFICGKEYGLISAHLQPSQFLSSLTKVGKNCLYVMHVTQQLVDKHNSWIYRMVLKIFFGRKKIVTVSKGLEDELIRKYGFHSENIKTIYNPCTVSALKSIPKLGSSRRKYILVMGRLEEQKNPLLALDLYYKGCFYNSYNLVYLGKGSLERKLMNQIDIYKLQDYVYLAGFQKSPEQWIKNASLLLSCSKWEGFAMNLAEALICGTPVVASDCPYGPGEIMIDELAKYLIYPEKGIEKSISTIWSALKFYPEITKKYYEKFEDELIAQTYLNVWEKYFGIRKRVL